MCGVWEERRREGSCPFEVGYEARATRQMPTHSLEPRCQWAAGSRGLWCSPATFHQAERRAVLSQVPGKGLTGLYKQVASDGDAESWNSGCSSRTVQSEGPAGVTRVSAGKTSWASRHDKV